MEGVLLAPPRMIQSGKAWAISLDDERGSEVPGPTEIAPLSELLHEPIAGTVADTHIRIVGLRSRAFGSLVPGQRTVITRLNESPTLSLAKSRT